MFQLVLVLLFSLFSRADAPPSLRADQIPYEVISRHDGLPYVVMIHDQGANRQAWWHTSQWLTHEYEVVVYDQRGHGDSQVKATTSVTKLAEDLLVLIDSLKVPSVHLIADSRGGLIAARFAQLYPERVLSVSVESHQPNLPTEVRDMLREVAAPVLYLNQGVTHDSQFKEFLNETVKHMHESEGSYKFYFAPRCRDIFAL